MTDGSTGAKERTCEGESDWTSEVACGALWQRRSEVREGRLNDGASSWLE